MNRILQQDAAQASWELTAKIAGTVIGRLHETPLEERHARLREAVEALPLNKLFIVFGSAAYEDLGTIEGDKEILIRAAQRYPWVAHFVERFYRHLPYADEILAAADTETARWTDAVIDRGSQLQR